MNRVGFLAILLGFFSAGMPGQPEASQTPSAVEPIWCTDCGVLDAVRDATGDCLSVPDLLVDLRPYPGCESVEVAKLSTGEPATCSIQAALDYVNAQGDPTPGDGEIFIGVTAQDPASPPIECVGDCASATGRTGRPAGGAAELNVAIDNRNRERLRVMGCRVTIGSGDESLPVVSILGGEGPIAVAGINVQGGQHAGYWIESGEAPVTITHTTVEATNVGFHVQGTERIAIENATVTGSANEGVVLDDVTQVTFEGVTIDNSGATGLRGSAVGSATLRSCRITNVNGADGSGIEFTDSGTGAQPSDLRISNSTFSSSTTGKSFLLVTARGSSNMSLTVEKSLFTGLTGQALHAASADTSSLVTTIRDCTFADASGHGLGGINAVAISAAGSSTHTATVSGNNLENIMRAGGNAGSVAVSSFDSATVAVTLDSNKLTDIPNAQGFRLVSENTGGGAFEGVVTGNTLDGIGRQAIFVSSRSGTQAMDLRIADNWIGQSAPVAFTDRNAIELTAENDGRLDVEVTGNTVTADTNRNVLALFVDQSAEVQALLGGPNPGDGNTWTNARSGGRARNVVAETASEGANLCLALANNTAAGVPTFELINSGGRFRVEDRAAVEARNTGSVTPSGDIVDVAAGTCKRPKW